MDRPRFGVAVLLLLTAGDAVAGNLLDYLRSYDLNDYALGIAISTRQSPYIGGENATAAYPYLTSFTDSSMTDSPILIRDGGYGLRWLGRTGWELGAIARFRVLNLGNSKAEELVGMADREWTIELGPTIGYRGWPININWTWWQEVTDRHGGYTSDIAFSWPVSFARGFIVPRIDAVYESGASADYYFAVTEAEVTPTRPAYAPGASWSTKAEVRIGYALTPEWLLSATVGFEKLGPEIAESPIVGRDRVWFGRLGFAYNANIFNAREFGSYSRHPPTFDLRIGAFAANIDSQLRRNTANGVPGDDIDLENVLGVPKGDTTLELDALWRIGQHHQLELGYFDLVRKGTATLREALRFGDETFATDTEIDSRIEYRSIRLGYTFFLMRDAQKELGIMAGIHVPEFRTEIVANGTAQRQSSSSNTPLPVVGVNGAVFLGGKTTVRARIHVFRTEFDEHKGLLNYAALDLERQLSDLLRVGIGYDYYATTLRSNDADLHGEFRIRHDGPVVYATVGF